MLDAEPLQYQGQLENPRQLSRAVLLDDPMILTTMLAD
jgi:hypothetical protein